MACANWQELRPSTKRKRNTRYKLTWIERSRRWKKRYRGKDHYFPLEAGETKASSYGRCLAAWQAKKQELDQSAAFPVGSLLTLSAEYYRTVQQAAQNRDDITDYLDAQEVLRRLEVARLRGIAINVNEDGDITLPASLATEPASRVETKAIDRTRDKLKRDLDATKALSSGATERPWNRPADSSTDRTIGTLLLAFEKAYPKVSTHRVNRYRQWCDLTADVSIVNGAHCRSYLNHLESLTTGEHPISRSYAMDCLKTLKHFVRFLVDDFGAIEHLPKNFGKLFIEVPITSVETFDVATIHQLLRGGRLDEKPLSQSQAEADERLRLYFLLMLNCGFYQIDCAELRQSQVDWSNGRITRKRTKLENSGGNVPTVTYQLWEETFSLLFQHRSSDPQRVLVNRNGKPCVTKNIAGRGRNDSIKSAFNRFQKRLKLDCLPMKHLRKTTASIIASKFGEDVSTLFLADAPTSTAGKHYIAIDDERLDDPLKYAREKLQIAKILNAKGTLRQ